MKYPLKNILTNFLNHVEDLETRRSLNDDQYEIEFQKLKHLTDTLKWDPEYSSVHGQKEVNRPKNRYKDIVPYDFCRVILPECAGIPGSDYVNASHVKGASGAFAYIAAQGPLPNTVIDFWKMIWICDVQVIVMACNERESGKTKCEAYWPETEDAKEFGTISIKFLSQTQVCPDFLVRTLLVCNEEETRQIWQFHYTSWPDHGVPDSVQPILELVRLVRDCQASETAPILVHCSAGCGRTGTICAIDFIWACLRTGKLTENFCLYDIVAEMRRQRIAMVQTKEQYMLVHKAVSTMFEQQLQLIDSHTYENLDKDGSPLTWNSSINVKKSNGSSSFAASGKSDSSLQTLLNEKKNENLLEDLTKQLKKQLMEKTDTDTGNNILTESVKCMTFSKTDYESSTPDETSNSLPETDLSSNNTSDIKTNNKTLCDSQSSALLLSSPESADSIPFIDDDDSKSDIHVRARCGRAYLHIPSCDSISKIVDRFDPFVDKVWAGIDDSCPETGDHYHSLPASVAGQMSNSENSSIISTYDQMNVKCNDVWLKSEELSMCPSTVKCESYDGLVMTCESKNTNGLKSVDRSIQVDSEQCNVAIGEGTSNKKTTDNDKSFSRRPSIIRLKGLFDRSSKCKSNGKTSLFRHHSHHVSRAGSAPPSLNSMKQSSEKESLFSMVTRKFRSSSVKSEHELKKENSSSHVATLKRSALTSFSNLKQNISNFSRNMAFSVHKTPQKQADLTASASVVEKSRSSTSENDNNSKEETSEQFIIENEAPYVSRKESQVAGKVEKLPPSFNYSDGREGAQQKFVVNVLSSSHGQNVMKIGKTFPPVPEKTTSPKSKYFMSDFECLKANPIWLLAKTVSSKPNPAEPSSFWYGYQEEIANNLEDPSSSSTSTLTKTGKTKTSGTNSNQKNLITSAKSSNLDSQSVFYTITDEHKDTNQNLYVAAQPEKVGSSFFWPLSPLKQSSEKTSIANSIIEPCNKNNNPVLENTSLQGTVERKVSTENKVLMNENYNLKDTMDPILNMSQKLKVEEPSRIVKASNDFLQVKPLEHLISSKIEGGYDDSLSMSRKNSDSGSAKSSSSNNDQSLLISMTEPPALPKKTVIGKNKNINAKFLQPVVKSVAEPTEANLDAANNSDAPEEIKSVNTVKVEDLKEDIAKPVDSKADLYINVNVVTKKNIEQIESTLRNHPRGAIIDLTSRHSYSMEEELKAAVQNLPEPVKFQNLSTSLTAARKAGYEVIWPESGSSLPLFKNRSNSDASQELKSGPVNKDGPNSIKRSGICYSPPLRRSPMSSFPVLKSHSCASLAWLHGKNDELFKGKPETPSGNPQTNETLVNEAVVELSTLLDELTTKTLADDLVLQSPKLPKKQSRLAENLALLPKTPNNSQASSPDVSRRRLNSPHKYETIYLPQKQALSIKNGDEEEIIFHFPPPPRVPPPPPSQESVVESFDLLCRDGRLHFSTSKKADISINTDIEINASDHEQEISLLEEEIDSSFSVPIPIPRKTKQTSTKSLNSLRKSVSYNTLVNQIKPVVEENSEFLDRPKTLPRSQGIDQSQKVSSVSSSLSSGDDESSEKANSAYEQIFPSSYKVVSETSVDASFHTSQVSEASVSQIGNIREMQTILNNAETNSESEKKYHGNSGDNKDSKIHQDVDTIFNANSRSTREFTFSESIGPFPSNKSELQKMHNLSELSSKTEKVSQVYGKVKRIPGQTLTSSKEREGQELGGKKTSLRSRKLERAPLPPSPKFDAVLFDASLEAHLLKHKKRPSYRKSEKAPDPPPLQKSSSLRACSSSLIPEHTNSRTIPAYAAIKKHKLPLVLENISDSQSALKSNNLRELESIYDKDVINRSHQRTQGGRGLQHSQSDASVFYALQSKYQGKVDIRSKDVLSTVRKISESSSDSDNSFRRRNISDEQKLQKNILKQKGMSPVAPPRSRRRSTVEIHYVKELAGAAKVKTLPKGTCDDSCEQFPSVPAKTKEAFEIPEEFKAVSQSRSHSVRNTGVKDRQKDPPFHHV